MRSFSRPAWPLITAVALLALGVVAAVVLLGGGDESETAADAQRVTFQEPTDDGPDPFTRAADVRGGDRVDVGSGPFGGTGSDLVCDRELLIDSLRAQPDRLREWARVLQVEPTDAAVSRYIRRLRPVTLTRDTRVTNHSFVDGRAVPFQSILQAGTAVLVDKDGKPVARCRCGNPLLEPVFIEEASCFGCPPNYRPPPPCEYYDYDDAEYNRYGDGYWKRVYVRSQFADVCYLPYPSPPRVNRRPSPGTPSAPTPPDTQQATNPAASFTPASGTSADTYSLFVSGFRPNAGLSVRLTRPDGVGESYAVTTDATGSGSLTFPRVADAISGTYTATVTDPVSGDTATATATVAAPTEAPPAEEPSPPAEPPPSDYECPDQPPASPGEDYLRNCPSG